jgi:hypothetical protein
MKKSTAKTGTSSRSKSNSESSNDLQSMAEEVIKYIEAQAKNIDKATLAKYAAIAVLVIYGLRRSNVLGSLALSLITGLVTKYISDQFEGNGQETAK